jgi:hypothetical protein
VTKASLKQEWELMRVGGSHALSGGIFQDEQNKVLMSFPTMF